MRPSSDMKKAAAMGEQRATLLREPPPDPSKSPMENTLEVTELVVLGPDIYTNTRPAWHPPGERGIYGGSVIALCLSAGFRTVPEGLAIHSLHCYFLLAGDGTVPLLLHVERVRDGRSFATRTVQARQKGRAIFTATMSFVRHEPDGNAADAITHALPMPTDVTPPPSPSDDGRYTNSADSPMARVRIAAPRYPSESSPARRTERAWIRARGRISDAGGPRAHAAALAYMSDSSFVATVARVHGLREPWAGSAATRATPRVGADERTTEDGRRIGMMVSIDHAIYFHVPMALSEGSPRADEWMLTEMDSPWAGDERGVVTQRIYARDGTLLATCIQEGLIRMKRESSSANASKPKL